MISRLELVILFSTRFGNEWGEAGSPYGVIGADLFADILSTFESEGQVKISPEKGGASLGIYFMPCRAFGILDSSVGSEEAPIRITPLGKKIHEARKRALGSSPLAEIVFSGGTLSRSILIQDGKYFSVNGIHQMPEELELLESAFFNPYLDEPAVKSRYDRFNKTVKWALSLISGQSGSSAECIAQNFLKVTGSKGEDARDDELAWTEYELRRRVHFACELLLSALRDTLGSFPKASVYRVIQSWNTADPIPDLIKKESLSGSSPLELTLREFDNFISYETYMKGPLEIKLARGLTDRSRALYAIGLLNACWKQAKPLIQKGWLPSRGHYMERAFAIIEQSQDKKCGELMADLLTQCVIESHLKTTLRKLGQGQKCSLRFYPEGDKLIPTGASVAPGYSQDRLGNVLGMLVDLGYCHRQFGGFSLSDKGKAFLSGPESVA